MSDLENQIIADMIAIGLNPLVPEHVRKFWEERLA